MIVLSHEQMEYTWLWGPSYVHSITRTSPLTVLNHKQMEYTWLWGPSNVHSITRTSPVTELSHEQMEYTWLWGPSNVHSITRTSPLTELSHEQMEYTWLWGPSYMYTPLSGLVLLAKCCTKIEFWKTLCSQGRPPLPCEKSSVLKNGNQLSNEKMNEKKKIAKILLFPMGQ